jgi:DNA ligase (NAD+)
VEALAAAPSDRLASIEGIGPEIAQAVSQWFANPANQTLIERLQQAGLTLASAEPTAPAVDQPLAGKTFVLTGTLPHLTRPQATAKIEAVGGKVVSSVSQVTDYVVAGDKAGSKLTKAEKLGIPVLDETALLDLMRRVADA